MNKNHIQFICFFGVKDFEGEPAIAVRTFKWFELLTWPCRSSSKLFWDFKFLARFFWVMMMVMRTERPSCSPLWYLTWNESEVQMKVYRHRRFDSVTSSLCLLVFECSSWLSSYSSVVIFERCDFRALIFKQFSRVSSTSVTNSSDVIEWWKCEMIERRTPHGTIVFRNVQGPIVRFLARFLLLFLLCLLGLCRSCEIFLKN